MRVIISTETFKYVEGTSSEYEKKNRKEKKT